TARGARPPPALRPPRCGPTPAPPLRGASRGRRCIDRSGAAHRYGPAAGAGRCVNGGGAAAGRCAAPLPPRPQGRGGRRRAGAGRSAAGRSGRPVAYPAVAQRSGRRCGRPVLPGGGGPAPPDRGVGPPPCRRAWSDQAELVAGASGDQRAEGDGADDAVRLVPDLLLDRVDGLLGLRSVAAVRVGGGRGLVAVGLEGLLHGPDLVPLVAVLGQAEAGAQRGPGLGVVPARVRDVALALVL